MFNFYLLYVKSENRNNHVFKNGKPKRGVARIKFLDVMGKDEYYDLRGGALSNRQFLNWAKREFGYLRYEVEFG